MSPPSSMTAENEYWTDEGIFMSLLDFKSGKPLPSNVDSELNPYHYPPQHLPDDRWYFCSGVKKDAEFGYWLATGEACEIYSKSDIHGFRTTLRFYEGQTPHGRKTHWVMQQYTISTNKSKNNINDLRALCRVFLADDNEPSSGNRIANLDDHLRPITVSNVQNLSEMDCILTGDYFELNDLLDDPAAGSHSSSSASSSCLTMTSDEYFDSIALLQQLDNKDEEMKDSTVNFNLSAPTTSKLVICPVTSVSLRNETPQAKEVAMKKSISNGVKTPAESSSKEGKKEGIGRKKRNKMTRYFCCLEF